MATTSITLDEILKRLINMENKQSQSYEWKFWSKDQSNSKTAVIDVDFDIAIVSYRGERYNYWYQAFIIEKGKSQTYRVGLDYNNYTDWTYDGNKTITMVSGGITSIRVLYTNNTFAKSMGGGGNNRVIAFIPREGDQVWQMSA